MILVIVVRVIIGIWSKTCSNDNVTYLVLVYDGIIFVIDDYISCSATDHSNVRPLSASALAYSHKESSVVSSTRQERRGIQLAYYNTTFSRLTTFSWA